MLAWLVACPCWILAFGIHDEIIVESQLLENDVRPKRAIQLSVPTVFAGMRVSPSIWRWMLNTYGVSATTTIGVRLAETDAEAHNKRGRDTINIIRLDLRFPWYTLRIICSAMLYWPPECNCTFKQTMRYTARDLLFKRENRLSRQRIHWIKLIE